MSPSRDEFAGLFVSSGETGIAPSTTGAIPNPLTSSTPSETSSIWYAISHSSTHHHPRYQNQRSQFCGLSSRSARGVIRSVGNVPSLWMKKQDVAVQEYAQIVVEEIDGDDAQ